MKESEVREAAADWIDVVVGGRWPGGKENRRCCCSSHLEKAEGSQVVS